MTGLGYSQAHGDFKAYDPEAKVFKQHGAGILLRASWLCRTMAEKWRELAYVEGVTRGSRTPVMFRR